MSPPAPEAEHSPPAPEAEHSPPAPEAEHSPPAPEAEHSPPAPEAEHSPPAPEAEHSPPAPEARQSPLPAAVVFDLDGTIVDTEQPAFEAWRRTWEDHGHELRLEDWVLCVGTDWNLFDPLRSLGQRVGRGFDAEAARHAKRQLEAELVSATVVRDGVEAWLDEAAAAGVPVGLASSSPRDWVASHLERLNLASRFTTVQTRTEVGVTKPDAAAYLAACAALDVAPAAALAVEDSANGVAAAKAAGMPTVAFPNPITAGLDLSAADLVVEDLTEWTLARAWSAVAPFIRRPS